MTLLGEATEQGLRAQLEPDACCALPYTDGTLYAASSAVSAKRQADALTRIADAIRNDGHPRGDVLHWLEQIAHEVKVRP